MKERGFADVKAHFSEVVDDAYHHQRSTMVLRRGKPVAVVVPVGFVIEAEPAPAPMTREEAEAFCESLAEKGDPTFNCTEDLIAGRR